MANNSQERFSYCNPPKVRKAQTFSLFSGSDCYVVVATGLKDVLQAKGNKEDEFPVLIIRKVYADSSHALKDILSTHYFSYEKLHHLYNFNHSAGNPVHSKNNASAASFMSNGNPPHENKKNIQRKSLRHVCDFYGMVGFVRFVKGYYLIIIKQVEKVGAIGTHNIFTVKETEMITLYKNNKDVNLRNGRGPFDSKVKFLWSRLTSSQSPSDIAEERYRYLFQLIDLTKCFYFSYTYDLTQSLQVNIASTLRQYHRHGTRNSEDVYIIEGEGSSPKFQEKQSTGSNSRYIWNHFLTRELLNVIYKDDKLDETKINNNKESMNDCRIWNSVWTVALIHGSFSQQRCSVFSKALTLTLIARRSRLFAGTRYLKRGVNDQGNVANDVEIEQIVQDEGLLRGSDYPCISSYVQVRGSIPTFWTQETSVAMPKPPILQFRYDPSFTATRKHFEDLLERYGYPAINLVKQHERQKRETAVGKEYLSAVHFLNSLTFRVPQSRNQQKKIRSFITNYSSEGSEKGPSSQDIKLEGPVIKYLALDFARLSKEKSSILLQALDEVAKTVIDSTGIFVVTKLNVNHSGVRSRLDHTSNNHQKEETGQLHDADCAEKVWSPLSNSFVPFTEYGNSHDSDRHAFSKDMLKLLSEGNRKSTTPTKEDIMNKRTFWSSTSSPVPNQGEKSTSFRTNRTSSGDLLAGKVLNFDRNKSFKSSRSGNLRTRDSTASFKSSRSGNLRSRDSTTSVKTAASHFSYASTSDDDMLDAIRNHFGEFLSPSSYRTVGPLPDDPPVNPSKWYSDYEVFRQVGVSRTNCIDCLDRTNVAQFCVGLRALSEQLKILSIIKEPDLKPGSKLVLVLMKLYEELGDRISLQYGGSSAHKKGSKLLSDVSLTISRQKELLTSVKRYYSNSFTDHAKQDAINLFLGIYTPPTRNDRSEMAAEIDKSVNRDTKTELLGSNRGDGGLESSDPAAVDFPSKKHLWELDSDFYLHNLTVCSLDAIEDNKYRKRTLDKLDKELSWWVDPLKRFEEKTTLPLHRLRIRQRVSGNGKDPSPKTDKDSPNGITSFDDLFSKKYFRPNELCTVTTKELKAAEKPIKQAHTVHFSSELMQESKTPGERGEMSNGLVNSLKSWSSNFKTSAININGDDDLEESKPRNEGFSNSCFDYSLEDIGVGVEIDVDLHRPLPHICCSQKSIEEYGKYARYAHDNFALYRDDDPIDQRYRKTQQESYEQLMRESLIHEDDAWGMKRLNAYAGATTVLVSGLYKGLPRSFPANVIYVDKIKRRIKKKQNEEISITE